MRDQSPLTTSQEVLGIWPDIDQDMKVRHTVLVCILDYRHILLRGRRRREKMEAKLKRSILGISNVPYCTVMSFLQTDGSKISFYTWGTCLIFLQHSTSFHLQRVFSVMWGQLRRDAYEVFLIKTLAIELRYNFSHAENRHSSVISLFPSHVNYKALQSRT